MLEKIAAQDGCQTLKKLGSSPTIIQSANFHSTARNDVSEKERRLTKEEILNMRQQVIGPCTTVFYKSDPLLVARASGQYLYDEHGNRHLDCISNVQHVGHCHPAVVEAVTKQMSMTNCNSRFVHENIVLCGQRLLATLPPQLDRIFFVNSGSEANDLALRIARDFTGGHDMVVIDHAYHGHLTSTIDMIHINSTAKEAEENRITRTWLRAPTYIVENIDCRKICWKIRRLWRKQGARTRKTSEF